MPTAKPLVSIIVPTRNSGQFLRACLKSVLAQTYPHTELIVVDRDSTDATKAIAAEFTPHVLNHGPERSAQRNFGVEQAKGDYVLIIDSDMELGRQVAGQCVAAFLADAKAEGIVIHEESFGEGFWAQCKRLERSFYIGVSWMEAARCFKTATYRKLGGYNVELVSGEDWDLSHRAEALGSLASIDEYIRHNEGRIRFWNMLKKKYYYAQHARQYLAQNPVKSKLTAQVGPLQRYKLFFSRPGQLFREPLLGLGMLLMKTAEFGAGAAGYYIGYKQAGTK